MWIPIRSAFSCHLVCVCVCVVLHSRAYFSYKFYDLMGFSSASLCDPFQSHQQHFTEIPKKKKKPKRRRKKRNGRATSKRSGKHAHTPTNNRQREHEQIPFALLLKRRRDGDEAGNKKKLKPRQKREICDCVFVCERARHGNNAKRWWLGRVPHPADTFDWITAEWRVMHASPKNTRWKWERLTTKQWKSIL